MDSAPATSSAGSTWHFESKVFNFSPQRGSRAPRGWDRQPKTPFALHQKGRKVWKRYALRSKDRVCEGAGDSTTMNGSNNIASPRAIKRLCVKQAPLSQPLSQKQKPSQYLATLQDKSLGTPRRKVAKRKSIRASRLSTDLRTVADDSFKMPQGHNKETVVGLQLSSADTVVLKVARHDNDGELMTHCQIPPQISMEEPLTRTTAELSDCSWWTHNMDDCDVGNSLAHGEAFFTNVNKEDEEFESLSVVESSVNVTYTEDCAGDSQANQHTQSSPLLPGVAAASGCRAILSEDFTSTQVTVLCNAKRRSNQEEDVKKASKNDEISPPAMGKGPVVEEISDNDNDISQDSESATLAQSSNMPTDKELDSTHYRQTSAIPVLDAKFLAEKPEQISNPSYDVTIELLPPQKAIEKQNETGSNTLLETVLNRAEVMQADLQSPPTRRTRLGNRFSDDTSMLKDFLNRAQARKVASLVEPALISYTLESPRRSPRKAPGQLDNNSPSPTKSLSTANRPGTPMRKSAVDSRDDEVAGELRLEGPTHRRSGRTFPTAQERIAQGPPSFIPVRRPDGSDPVVLPLLVAPEIATITRANTRRNKGRSKMPKTILETLAGEVTENLPPRKRGTRSAKSVNWDERLVYYQETGTSIEGKEEKEEKEEKAEIRRKVRRPKELGAASGTPTSKKITRDLPSNGTPAPRRRGKVKS